MLNFNELKPEKVFEYFDVISKIPRGSGNMEKISDFCMDFAKEHSLKAIKDDACNVIIYKDGTEGYENSPAVILQGHLDMVCQKEEDYEIDFEKDSLDLYVDGDFIKAKGTTLGADNGIAVAMIMSILADKTISHPPIEAVFTTDEEVGMLGALELDMKNLKAKKMINIDSEDPEVVTVSCAGGSDFTAKIPLERTKKQGEMYFCYSQRLKGWTFRR
ncbi:MAG: M20/M25/M40 family metallo-hydrolase [Clostridia bacterium]|nr:M20/M25/M40 family metallo-hydrolase [Clostridia bacterium]